MYIHNFAREDSKGSFVELSDYPFDIGKILINFVKYNDETHKQEFNIPIYLDFKDFFGIIESVKSGRVYKRIHEEIKKGNTFANVNQFLSGDSSEKAKTRKYPFSVPEGKAVSKSFQFSPSKKSDYLIKACYSIGREEENGLIVPDGKVINYIQIPMSHQTLVGFLTYGYVRIQAYENMKMLNFKDEFNMKNWTWNK